MPEVTAELSSRRPVWIALASMFLASEVAHTREWRAGVLAASPYALSELDEILIGEIYPICWGNLGSAAGERVAFDSAQLEALILSRAASGEVYTRLRELGRLAVPRSSEWQATKLAIAELRRVDAPGQA